MASAVCATAFLILIITAYYVVKIEQTGHNMAFDWPQYSVWLTLIIGAASLTTFSFLLLDRNGYSSTVGYVVLATILALALNLCFLYVCIMTYIYAYILFGGQNVL